jgi:polysaccharide pyruvyl transferase WcaK-like protein
VLSRSLQGRLDEAGTSGGTVCLCFRTAETALWPLCQNKGVRSSGVQEFDEKGQKHLSEAKTATKNEKRSKIVIFGNFGTDNFGNEATLQAVHFNLRRLMPDAELACICDSPVIASATYNIAAFPISPKVITGWTPKSRAAQLLRRMVFGIPNELYRWVAGFRFLKGADALIIPGTGLLTDVHDLLNWGPYGVFRWSVLAKLRGCKLLFVSVGVGPLYGRLGREFAKLALGLADFRSYRDLSSLEYLKSIGFATANDRVYPDLAFSLPTALIPRESQTSERRPVVGIGLMDHAHMYGDITHDDETYRNYTETFLALAKWLRNCGYDIRLLVGHLRDPVSEFRRLLDEKLPRQESTRVVLAPVTSVEDLLAQFADTDFAVVTRFHNIVFALFNDKPVISISFHSKCASLMYDMGLSEYCLQIDQLEIDKLIEKVGCVQEKLPQLKALIASRKEKFRLSLEEQYQLIVSHCGVQAAPIQQVALKIS